MQGQITSNPHKFSGTSGFLLGFGSEGWGIGQVIRPEEGLRDRAEQDRIFSNLEELVGPQWKLVAGEELAQTQAGRRYARGLGSWGGTELELGRKCSQLGQSLVYCGEWLRGLHALGQRG